MLTTTTKQDVLCTTCGKNLLGSTRVTFACPRCGKQKITRCKKCRVLKNKYTCKECGFVGP